MPSEDVGCTPTLAFELPSRPPGEDGIMAFLDRGITILDKIERLFSKNAVGNKNVKTTR